MSCETFQQQVVECAASVGARSPQLRAHLAECVGCAAVAREQERLALLLASLRTADALSDESARQAAARLESTLLAEFRRQHADSLPAINAQPPSSTGISASTQPPPFFPYVPSASSAVNVPPSSTEIPRLPQQPQAPSLWRWGALAAGILLALGILLRVSQAPSLPPPPGISHRPSPPSDPRILRGGSVHGESTQASLRPAEKPGEGSETSEKPSEVESVKFAERAEPADAPRAPEIARAAGPEFSAASEVSANAAGFIELLPPTPGFLDDGPAVMRVRVPWSTIERLRSMRGAPLAVPAGGGFGAERGFAQADLLVGADGTARAIRFVQ